MWGSLSKLAKLPPDTIVCSGHEYTEANLKFAEHLTPEHQPLVKRAATIRALRGAGKPTVPSLLSDELKTNPFLRVTDPSYKSEIGMKNATDADCFAHVRSLKDRF